MSKCEPLAWYGAFVVIVVGGLILIPYMRKKGDLLSAWSILLLGIAMFLGLGCVEAANSPIRFHGLEWFQPTAREVNWFLIAASLFLATLILSYYYDPLSKAVAARCLNKWPPITTGTIIFVLIVCGIVTGISYFTMGRVFFGPLFVNLSHKAVVFAAVFSFVLWYRNRLNVMWLALFIGVFLAACLFATLAGGGRRLLLSVLLGPVLCVYMANLRYWKPAKSAIAVALATIALFVITLMYSSIRHFERTGGNRERTAAAMIEQVRQIGDKNWLERFTADKLFFFSQQTVHYSLLTDRFVRTGRLEAKPLNTLRFLAVYPIPRAVWPNKPRILGLIIVHEIIGYQTTNWGCGVVGQVAYEGGFLVAILYGYLAAFGIRLIDDPLQRQPLNPYLLSILASAAPHILAWPRGDLGIMTIETVECFLYAVVLGIAGRALFGTQRLPLPTRQDISYLPYIGRAHVS